MFANPTSPNLADFTTFVLAQGIPSADLSTPSDYVQWALDYAENVTLNGCYIPAIVYVMAVYNLGMHHLLHIGQDISPSTFFTDARSKYGLLTFVGGAILDASDQGTSGRVSGSQALSNLSLSAMDALKTPWGQQYLFYAQQYGPNIVAVS